MAALATLQIQKSALSFDMTLKDASAYNIQFQENKAILIDTLSFEEYKEGRPWDGYNQFCKHFLAPLLLMSYLDMRLSLLMRVFIDGIPLDIVSSMLPKKTRYNLSIAAHIHMHAKAQKRYTEGEQKNDVTSQRIKKEGILALLDSLERLIQKLTWGEKDTSWGDYRSFHNYSKSAYNQKKDLIREFVSHAQPSTVWDFGANTGDFSRLASEKGITTVAFDIDHGAVEQGFLQSVKEGDKYIHHAIIDLFNPSPSLGWSNQERKSLIERGPVDLLMALALIHHLAIGNNLPLDYIGSFFASLTDWLIIEFVPKEDDQVKKLLSSRRDIFEDYHQSNFEEVLSKYFTTEKKVPVKDTLRTLYLMKKVD
jgi:ribosomal protein L11 methylase PrmA